MFLVIGCVTSSPYDRGPLSEAMEKARDDYPDDREVDNRRDDPTRDEDFPDPWDNDSVWEKDEDYQDEIESIDLNTATDWYIGLRGGSAIRSSPYFDSLFDAEVFCGFRDGSGELQFFGGIKAATVKPGDPLEESVDDGVVFLRGGMEFRVVPFPQWDFISPYLSLRAGGLYMYWTFENPLTAGTEEITRDSVGGMLLGAGPGVNIINHERFRLGTAFIPEINLFYSETKQGFQNDVFSHYFTTRWVVEVVLM